jgi:hypothetical protein
VRSEDSYSISEANKVVLAGIGIGSVLACWRLLSIVMLERATVEVNCVMNERKP